MKNNELLLIGGVVAVIALLRKPGGIGAITEDSPPGKTPCRDGKFSTFPMNAAGGVCSYHGGRAAGNMKEKEPAKAKKIHLMTLPEFRSLLASELLADGLKEKEIISYLNTQAQETHFNAVVAAAKSGLFVPKKVIDSLDSLNKYWYQKNIQVDIDRGLIKMVDNRFIGAIFPEIPGEFYECADGTFTDKNSRRACSWHGGLKSGEAIPTGGGPASALMVQDVPLALINTKPEWFQNRADAYSSRSVENIVAAVLDNTFNWANFDPVLLWKDKDGKLYILSGHSRKEAFKRLADMGATYDGRKFDIIPAKIDDRMTLEQAQETARQSNTLSTPETVLERTAYYRRLLLTGNFTGKQLDEAARKSEGRNANTVLALAFLNPDGKTWRSMLALQSADETSRGNLENLARWIGNARRAYPALTDQHENELYDWLVTGGGYGTSRGQISSERDFKNELYRIIDKRTEFGVFNQNAPLNITNARYSNPVEQEYNRQVAELQAAIRDLESEKKKLLRTYATASPEDLRRILQPIEAGIRIKGQELQRLLIKKDDLLSQGKNQGALFGHWKRIY
jgi:hypothetical protein